jgi:hypothetical protein|tara:strand:+ start:2800 stop:3663 length:864 start_codon:yes stop_codon:yes gene_type:complete
MAEQTAEAQREAQLEEMVAKFQKPQTPLFWHDYRHPLELKRAREQSAYGYPHLSPGSCMVAAIGTTWKPGSWQKVVDMVQYARQNGYNAWLEEIPDPLVTEPYAGVGNMKDTAVGLAQVRGFEWICFVENDVLPKEDLLVNLIERDIPIVAPRVLDPSHPGETIGFPDWEPKNGLFPMRWVPSSFMLFRTTVFNCIPRAFISIVTEGELFLRLWNYGHRVYQDTDNPLEIASPPSYRQESYDERIEFLRKADASRRKAPDRSPIDPETPTIAGMYAPWWTQNGAKPE